MPFQEAKCWILALTDVFEKGFLSSKDSFSAQDSGSVGCLCIMRETLFF